MPAAAGKRKSKAEASDEGPSRKRPKAAAKHPRSPPKGTSPKKQQQERRARRFRDHAPRDFEILRQRALSQRFYVLSRTRTATDDGPSELVQLTGSTGNVYHVRIATQPRCTCPHARKGNQCKHMVFVLSKVLHAPHHLVYQLALLSTELTHIFANAPPIGPSQAESVTIEDDPNRKPVEGDCPICFSELDPGAHESIVWCRAACGQNLHKDCLAMWARSTPAQATCPMCRSPWAGDEGAPDAARDVDLTRARCEDGYLNVRNQLPGVSAVRDSSTYNSYGGYYGVSRRRRC